MTIFATDNDVKLTDNKARLRKVASVAMLQDFLEDTYVASDAFTKWVSTQTEFQIDTREFGILTNNGMTTTTLTVIVLLPLERLGYSLVHYRDETPGRENAMRGFAELNECGDMLTPMGPNKLLRVHGDNIAAKLAEMVGDLREMSIIRS